jgi:hypothetical protein
MQLITLTPKGKFGQDKNAEPAGREIADTHSTSDFYNAAKKGDSTNETDLS